jgi:hypothetical protein
MKQEKMATEKYQKPQRKWDFSPVWSPILLLDKSVSADTNQSP